MTRWSRRTFERQAGLPRRDVGSGINPDTGSRWLRRGEKQAEGGFSEFSERVTRARARGELGERSEALEASQEVGSS